MEHVLKILSQFVEPIVSGDKNFEVRQNDRGFQKGDTVRFNVVNRHGLSEYDRPPIYDMLEHMTFKITYVLSGWGLNEEYVVFGMKPNCGADMRGEENE